MMVEQSKPLLFFLVGLASIFIIIAGIRDLAFILNPILLSLVITVTVIPLPAWFGKRGVPGWLALVLTFLIVLSIISVVLFIMFIGMAQLTEVLPSIRSTVEASSTAVIETPIDPLEMQIDELTTAIEAFLSSQRLSDFAMTILGALFAGISQAFLVLLIFAFMLSSALALPSSARLGLRTDHPMVNQAAALTADVRRYVTLTTALNVVIGIGNTILLFAMGIDLALLWGLLSALLGYIPAVGFWIAMIPPLALAFIGGGLPSALTVLAGYAIINGTIENLVKPRMLGKELKISPAVVVISLFVWGWLLGAIGAILSTPLTLLILNILEGFESTRWIAILLRTAGTGDPVETAERQAAFGHVRRLWDRGANLIRGNRSTPEETP